MNKTFKMTVKKFSGKTISKIFTDGHEAKSEAGRLFHADEVQAVNCVKNPGRTSTIILYLDKMTDRSNFINETNY